MLEATKKAKAKWFLFLATICVVDDFFLNVVVIFCSKSTTMLSLSTIPQMGNRDVVVLIQLWWKWVFKERLERSFMYQTCSNYLTKISIRHLRSLNSLMAENIRRSLQDINLGADDEPFVLPADVVRQVEEENRFILIGRPVMPRKQNLRAIVASMPRSWGFEGLVRGRIIEHRRFQFVFPSEEAMDTVIRRGPWAYVDRMLVLQRWTPLMDMAMLNFIPLWIQIRGIPLQYMNRMVIVNIARVLGEYIQMDYNEEVGSRMEFVRVRLN